MEIVEKLISFADMYTSLQSTVGSAGTALGIIVMIS
jgi:hypothetical protein